VVPGITAGLLAQSSATQDLSDVVEKRLLDIALIGRFDLNNCATSDAYRRRRAAAVAVGHASDASLAAGLIGGGEP
jgi:hypothetical protein